jgi:hypothetical protein
LTKCQICVAHIAQNAPRIVDTQGNIASPAESSLLFPPFPPELSALARSRDTAGDLLRWCPLSLCFTAARLEICIDAALLRWCPLSLLPYWCPLSLCSASAHLEICIDAVEVSPLSHLPLPSPSPTSLCKHSLVPHMNTQATEIMDTSCFMRASVGRVDTCPLLAVGTENILFTDTDLLI